MEVGTDVLSTFIDRDSVQTLSSVADSVLEQLAINDAEHVLEGRRCVELVERPLVTLDGGHPPQGERDS